MTSNVLQHRHFDLRQTINFAVEPIDNDDLDGERLRWRGREDFAGTMPRSSMFSFLVAGGKLFALELASRRFPDPYDSGHKAPGGRPLYHTECHSHMCGSCQRLAVVGQS